MEFPGNKFSKKSVYLLRLFSFREICMAKYCSVRHWKFRIPKYQTRIFHRMESVQMQKGGAIRRLVKSTKVKELMKWVVGAQKQVRGLLKLLSYWAAFSSQEHSIKYWNWCGWFSIVVNWWLKFKWYKYFMRIAFTVFTELYQRLTYLGLSSTLLNGCVLFECIFSPICLIPVFISVAVHCANMFEKYLI